MSKSKHIEYTHTQLYYVDIVDVNEKESNNHIIFFKHICARNMLQKGKKEQQRRNPDSYDKPN